MLIALVGSLLMLMLSYFALKQHELQRLGTKQLEESEKKYRTLLDASPDGIIIVDDRQCIHLANRKAEIFFGYSGEELDGQPIRMLIPEETREKHAGLADHYISDPHPRVMNRGRHVMARRKDGSHFTADISLSPADVGDQRFIISDIRDVSERVELEQQLGQAQKMEAIGTLVSGVAHNFNNYLAAISGSAYLAEMEAGESKGSLRERLKNIERLVFEAADLVRQLLTFARESQGAKRRTPLLPLVKEAIKTVQMGIPEDIACEVDIGQESTSIRCDPVQIKQAIINIVNNARDALEESSNKRISIRLTHIDREACDKIEPGGDFDRVAVLSIEDTGHGISDENIEKLFDPFFTTKAPGKGTGLGLPTAMGTIREHGGALEVESHLGEGTRFTLYLPVERRETPSSRESRQTVRSSGAETILLADDDEGVRETIGSTLESLGYRVIHAVDGEAELREFMAKQDEIRLVITDLVMPKLSGSEAVLEIRKLNPNLPVIYMTGYESPTRVDALVADNRTRLMTKPFRPDELSRVIADLLQTNADPGEADSQAT